MSTRTIVEDGSRIPPTPPETERKQCERVEAEEMDEMILLEDQFVGVRPSPSRHLQSAGGGRDLDAPKPGADRSLYGGDEMADGQVRLRSEDGPDRSDGVEGRRAITGPVTRMKFGAESLQGEEL